MSEITKSRVKDEYDDVMSTLGIKTGVIRPEENDSIIYLGVASGETLPLAEMISRHSKRVHIVLISSETGGTVVYKNKELIPFVSEFDNEFSLCEGEPKNDNFTRFGNSLGFGKYTDNKIRASIILKKNGIQVPREMVLRNSRWRKCEKPDGDWDDERLQIQWHQDWLVLRRFLENLGEGKRMVIKPYNGAHGEGIYIVDSLGLEALFDFEGTNEYGFGSLPETTAHVVVQEKIDSFPLFDSEKNRLDWNLRVLVTFDPGENKYIVAGVVARIDKDGIAVNISQSAQYASFIDIASRCGWSEQETQEVSKKVHTTAITTVETILSYIKTKGGLPDFLEKFNFQTLAGVDIIIDENMEPVVIEVNDSKSGCMYELQKLHGIDSLLPIARSIFFKATLSDIMRLIHGEFLTQIKPEIREQILTGELKLEFTYPDINGGIDP